MSLLYYFLPILINLEQLINAYIKEAWLSMPNIISRNIVTVGEPYTSDNKRYPINDLGSVYIHWDSKLNKNVPTENKLKGDDNNGKDSN